MSEDIKFSILGFECIGTKRSAECTGVFILINKNSNAVEWIRYVVEGEPLIYVINGKEYRAEIYRFPGVRLGSYLALMYRELLLKT